MAEFIKGNGYKYDSSNENTYRCKYYFDVTVLQFCRIEKQSSRFEESIEEKTYNFINFNRSKDAYEAIIDNNEYCDVFNKVFHRLVVKKRNGDICNNDELIKDTEYCVNNDLDMYTFNKRIDNCKLFIALMDNTIVIYNPELINSSYTPKVDLDDPLFDFSNMFEIYFTHNILPPTFDFSPYPLVTRDLLNANRLDDRTLDDYYKSLYTEFYGIAEIKSLSSLIFGHGEGIRLEKNIESDKCRYSWNAGSYEENISKFYALTSLVPKIGGDYFYLYRAVRGSLCFQPNGYNLRDRNIIVNLQMISCAYNLDFSFDEWGHDELSVIIKIRVPTKSNYLMNFNRSQSEITLAPGIFIINRISKIIRRELEQLVYEVDYEQFNLETTQRHLAQLSAIQRTEYTGDPMRFLSITTFRAPVGAAGGFYKKYLKYRDKYIKLKEYSKQLELYGGKGETLTEPLTDIDLSVITELRKFVTANCNELYPLAAAIRHKDGTILYGLAARSPLANNVHGEHAAVSQARIKDTNRNNFTTIVCISFRQKFKSLCGNCRELIKHHYPNIDVIIPDPSGKKVLQPLPGSVSSSASEPLVVQKLVKIKAKYLLPYPYESGETLPESELDVNIDVTKK